MAASCPAGTVASADNDVQPQNRLGDAGSQSRSRIPYRSALHRMFHNCTTTSTIPFATRGTRFQSYFTNASPVTRCHIAEQAIMIPAWYSAFIGSGISSRSLSADRYRPSSSAFHRESGRLIFLSSIVIVFPCYWIQVPLLTLNSGCSTPLVFSLIN